MRDVTQLRKSQRAANQFSRAKPTDYFDIPDRHNRAIAQILTRFRNMVMAATEPLPSSAAVEHASLNSLTMETETAALVSIYIRSTS
jgi:hypothetical protein